MRVIEEIARVIVKFILCTFVRVKVSGLENIPEKGGFIMAANHNSALDVIYVEYKLKRRVRWMAKAELFKNKLVGWFLKKLGAFPVKRGAVDINAAKTVFELLKDGEILGIFPQGTRSKDPANPVKARHGVAKFAVEAGVPVVPVALYGKFRIFGKAYVKYGKPFMIEKKADGTPYTKAEYTEISQKLVDDIYAMMTEDGNGNNKG